MKTLVIIVTYNGKKFVPLCLEGLNDPLHPLDCMIIDNASEDDTVEVIRKEYPWVKLICNEKNSGFGAANNIGLQYALDNGYEFVYLLNQDASISAEDIYKLIDVNLKYPDFGIVSPIQTNKEKTKLDNGFKNAIPPELRDDYILERKAKRDIYETPKMVQAAHWLVKCEVLRKVGGFSPAFFHYSEDHNYCHRIRYWGLKVGLVPGIYGVHDRENRKKRKGLGPYLKTQNWKHILSDPNVPNKIAIKMVARAIYKVFPDYKLKIYRPFFMFLKDFKKTLYYKKKSIEEGAFLKVASKDFP